MSNKCSEWCEQNNILEKFTNILYSDRLTDFFIVHLRFAFINYISVNTKNKPG